MKPPSIVVSGTDTGLGKTTLTALLMSAREEYSYWKPIQSGLADESDTETVQRVSQCGHARIVPERYRLTQPFSPHYAAELDSVSIDDVDFPLPDRQPLVVEGAGGLLVPINPHTLFIDLFQRWNLPVLLATRSSLGTINHTLLSLEALRARRIPILGVVMIGEINPPNEQAIQKYGEVEILGRIPVMPVIDRVSLQTIYRQEFGALEERLNA